METPAVGVTGGLRILLRLEGLALLAAMAGAFAVHSIPGLH